LKWLVVFYDEAQRGLHKKAVSFMVVVGAILVTNLTIYLVGGYG